MIVIDFHLITCTGIEFALDTITQIALIAIAPVQVGTGFGTGGMLMTRVGFTGIDLFTDITGSLITGIAGTGELSRTGLLTGRMFVTRIGFFDTHVDFITFITTPFIAGIAFTGV
jgi:hypothetical protein